MLASGAHVSIGGVEYLLDESSQDHYAHNYNMRAPYESSITGSEGKLTLKENKILWTWDDWSGGEGNKIYYPDEPTKYNYSTALNPRIRGLLMARPSRTLKLSATDNIGARPLFGTGAGKLWVTKGPASVGNWMEFDYTTDGTNWTEKTLTTQSVRTASARTTAVAGDYNYFYWANWDTNDQRQIGRMDRSLTEEILTFEGSSPPFLGMQVFDNAVYAWDGVALKKVDLIDFLTTDTVSPAVQDAPNGDDLYTTYWGDLIAADNQLLMFVTTDGFSKIYEYHLERGFGEVWQAPMGFAIKAICYQNGMLYAAGGYGGSNTSLHGYGALYGIDLDTRQAEFISFIRKQQNDVMQMTSLAPSYGDQILIGAGLDDGQVFVYDRATDAVTLLDDFNATGQTDAVTWNTAWEVSDVITYGKKRWAVAYKPGGSAATNQQIFSWDNDEIANRQATTATAAPQGSVYTGMYDLGYPYEGKLFHGVHVTYTVEDNTTTSGLDQNQQINIIAAFDDDSEVTVATIDETTTPSTGIKGRHFVSYLANNQKFYRMRLRIQTKTDGTAVAGDKTPIIQTVTVECSLDDYEETWDLTLRIKDELAQDPPADRRLISSDLRDNILNAVEAKDSVTFLDGYRYPERGDYTTHTVTIESPQDVISMNAEGSMRVRLRAVTQ